MENVKLGPFSIVKGAMRIMVNIEEGGGWQAYFAFKTNFRFQPKKFNFLHQPS